MEIIEKFKLTLIRLADLIYVTELVDYFRN